MHRMTPGLIGFSKVASGQLRVNRGHACWPGDFRSDDASVLLLLIASCDFMTQDQRPWRAPEEEPMTEATSAKPWLATYGDSIPAEIDANAYTSVVDMLEQAMRRYADRIAFCSFSNAITYAQPVDRCPAHQRLFVRRCTCAWRRAGVQAGRVER